MDVEISSYFHQITERTRNVTAVFDCCHSGKIARNLLNGGNAVPKGVSRLRSEVLENRTRQLQSDGKLDPSKITSLEGNPHLVRIVACAGRETAWENQIGPLGGQGAMTEALVEVMRQFLSRPVEVSWRKIMMRVSELEAIDFPDQRPHVEGPHEHVMFPLERKSFAAVPVRLEGETLILKAGRLAAVHENNQYIIMPYGYHEAIPREKIGIASVKAVGAFEAVLKAYQNIGLERLSLADGFCASFGFGSTDKYEAVKQAANQASLLSRASHLLNLKAADGEVLEHNLRVAFETFRNREKLPLDGTVHINDGDYVQIKLQNEGNVPFVSLFNINVAGSISLVTGSSPRGVELKPQEPYTVGKRQFDGTLDGLRVSWPPLLPPSTGASVSESFLCIISSAAVDLRILETPRQPRPRKSWSDLSQLEKLAYDLAYGQGRDCEKERAPGIRWNLLRVTFRLLYPQVFQSEISYIFAIEKMVASAVVALVRLQGLPAPCQ
ncbi:uncharacterized protein KD926_002594 [Aspergillus affinis]|uniref:uncharacterized protein n=1 Tax=Aspergillus affinis TaxID=1070780 RepID=UPI0022FE5791|nr:uncharacterized protein KD926_002594 [Aspergillus affinis]KAI9035929.1 hypothetical protein KD926_002594 [Aspergillus affinis]